MKIKNPHWEDLFPRANDIFRGGFRHPPFLAGAYGALRTITDEEYQLYVTGRACPNPRYIHGDYVE